LTSLPWPSDWIVPDWPAPAHVRAVITTRSGGVSRGPWGGPPDGGGGMNLGVASGDDPQAVRANRERLRALLPGEPRWLSQVHGATVVDADAAPPEAHADGAVSVSEAVVCAVTVADCLPVLLTDRLGRGVAVAHAGWRGLAAGVIERAVARLVARLRERCGAEPPALLAYLGPAIGAKHFEVGPDVLHAMRAALPGADAAFARCGDGRYLADLPALARQALARSGVVEVFGGGDCTYADARRFYSYRRDRVTGRHAALIWIEPEPLDSAGRSRDR
jgi:YfiH family protein